ncbi:hypothetical protein EW146_g3971 [Bondarzewia mesenterica]|uniref:Major facilitator superfamily (MFS) profile domain-containing protein n=1 Tax=Bondarzewia mesenterica TaxID=1095465 RepID=A0A4S4LX01_9AGAM|nr:hypothetical protein EW146_g3971 [Bondarzewia mesenterica]
MSEWFVKRRGLANDVIFAGTVTGGLVRPLILTPLFRHHGIANTLRYLSIAVIASLIPTLPFVRPRLTSAAGEQVTNKVQGFAYFAPIVWLPTYASALNISSSTSPPLERIMMDTLSDHLSPWLLGLTTLACISLAAFVLWGIAGHAVVVVGIQRRIRHVDGRVEQPVNWIRTTNCKCVSRPHILVPMEFGTQTLTNRDAITEDDPTLSTSLFGLLMLSRGLGNVLSTPISTALSAAVYEPSTGLEKTGFDVADGRYERMIVYVGTYFVGAAVMSLVGWGGERASD